MYTRVMLHGEPFVNILNPRSLEYEEALKWNLWMKKIDEAKTSYTFMAKTDYHERLGEAELAMLEHYGCQTKQDIYQNCEIYWLGYQIKQYYPNSPVESISLKIMEAEQKPLEGYTFIGFASATKGSSHESLLKELKDYEAYLNNEEMEVFYYPTKEDYEESADLRQRDKNTLDHGFRPGSDYEYIIAQDCERLGLDPKDNTILIEDYRY